MFSGINSIINLLRNNGGATLVKHARATPVKGRASLSPALFFEIIDIVHHPIALTNTRLPEGVSSSESITAYLRCQILPAVIDDNDAYYLIIEGKTYQVTRTQPWLAGGFWAVDATLIDADRGFGYVYFRAVTTAQSTESSLGMRLNIVKKGSCGAATTRDFRFELENVASASAVAIAWPQGIVHSSEAVTIRAINSSGAIQDVTPNSSVISKDYVIVMLPKIIANDGKLKYEVL
jgi:hypothetical protein